MTAEAKIALRLKFLIRVVRKECQHLTTTDQRLFGGFFTLEQATRLEEDPDLAERVELCWQVWTTTRHRGRQTTPFAFGCIG